MTEDMKIKLFEKMLEYEHIQEEITNGKERYDGRNYFAEGNGAWAMLEVLDLTHEYIEWSYGK